SRDPINVLLNSFEIQLSACFLTNHSHRLDPREFVCCPKEGQWPLLRKRRLVHSAVIIVVDALEIAEFDRFTAFGKDEDPTSCFPVLLGFLQLGNCFLRFVFLVFNLNDDALPWGACGLPECDEIVTSFALLDAWRSPHKFRLVIELPTHLRNN